MNLWTDFLLACAAGLALAWLVAAQRRLVAHLVRRFLSLPRLQQVALVLAVCISTVCAQKTVTNENAIVELSNNRIIESAEASASGSGVSHGGTETRSGEIIELSNNRIIESAEASASGSNDSRRAAENAEGEMATPQAEEESLSNHNSIIRPFDYSIIDSTTSATSEDSVLRAKTTLASSANPCQFVQSVAQGTEQESLSNRNSIIRTFDYSIISPSTFWHLLTPSNSLILTWQNVLLHRLPENSVSFQVEFFANGDFTYRYDFSQLPSDAVLTNAYVIAAPGIGEPFVLWEYFLTRRFRSLGDAEEMLEEGVS